MLYMGVSEYAQDVPGGRMSVRGGEKSVVLL